MDDVAEPGGERPPPGDRMAYVVFLLREAQGLVSDVASPKLRALLDEAVGEAAQALRRPL